MASFARASTVLAAMLLAAAAQAAPTPAWQIPEGLLTKSVNGYPIAYRTVGSGPTVVLVHGGICDSRCWAAQLQTLGKDFRLVAPNLRHFYPEPWNGKGETFSVDQHAKDVAAFIEGLDAAPVLVVGHSYGGRVAYEVARARPDLARKLVLAEAPLGPLLAEGGATYAVNERAAEIAKHFERGDMDSGLKRAIDAIGGAGAWERLPDGTRQVMRDNAWTIVGIARDDPPPVQCAAFGALQMPVLLIQGENTAQHYRRTVDAQSKCLPGAQVAQVPKSAHGMPWQNPTGFNQAVAEFLKQ